MHGWTARMLCVDLSNQSSTIDEIDKEILRLYFGGCGLGTYLVYAEVPPNTDPLGPENILAFCTGAMTGVRVPTGERSSMSTLSPLTSTPYSIPTLALSSAFACAGLATTRWSSLDKRMSLSGWKWRETRRLSIRQDNYEGGKFLIR